MSFFSSSSSSSVCPHLASPNPPCSSRNLVLLPLSLPFPSSSRTGAAMCVKDEIGEGELEEIQKSGSRTASKGKASSFADSPIERLCENTISIDHVNQVKNFVPMIRSGEWFDIRDREHMEDAHVCINDLAKKFSHRHSHDAEAVILWGNFYLIQWVFDGHGGKDAAHFVGDNLTRIVVEDPTS